MLKPTTGGTVDDDTDLYRAPVEILRRERDYLKERLKEERAELERFSDLATGVKSEMAGLIESVAVDVRATEDLLAAYKASIKKLAGR